MTVLPTKIISNHALKSKQPPPDHLGDLEELTKGLDSVFFQLFFSAKATFTL